MLLARVDQALSHDRPCAMGPTFSKILTSRYPYESHLTEEKTEAGEAKRLAQGPSAYKWQS